MSSNPFMGKYTVSLVLKREGDSASTQITCPETNMTFEYGAGVEPTVQDLFYMFQQIANNLAKRSAPTYDANYNNRNTLLQSST